ncbi:MAG: TRAP transporter substrate-binding protein DctP [Pandoraea sp.]|uniref:TRAP transporter substrate-binding protein DctP n=1 Tax=Pandoraea sp. 64-18 TaxID=1895806 RepID=UPI000961FA5A|nr:TRAP transporter substrate-binding protein DctP [Pandoraea sp. 64-18]MBN9116709.1 TRAP transporter substrate-binding protein DctP [Pandoraea sp.]OJY19338.1 MAG: C4-dicarboxylate ABC transporter [Pandoraea sp. 64-18]
METNHSPLRRQLMLGAASALATGGLASPWGNAFAQSGPLKISHQFPGGTLTEGDFRDRLCRKFAQEVETRTHGALKFQVYPGSSLMKTNAQFSALRRGALDLSLYPLPYAGGEVRELNIGLMPGLVTSYAQGAAWRHGEIGKVLTDVLAEKNVVIVSWVWQAGGVASRAKPLVSPDDAKGLKVRGGSREMDMMLKEAGAAVISLPSNELYAAMQTGAMDAAMTSSTSLMSFRLEEVSKHLTTGRNKSYWFMLEPLLMSKQVFDKLPKDQQQAILQVGAELESFGTEAAKADDAQIASVYTKAGAKVYDLDEATVMKWRDIARRTAWKDYAGRSDTCAKLLALAQQVPA